MTDREYVVLPREPLLMFFGMMALPPWRDHDGELIGIHMDCAPIASEISEWIERNDLSGLYAELNMTPFDPDWVVPTGEFILDFMHDNNIPSHVLAVECGLPHELLESVIAGETPVVEDIAEHLAAGTGMSATMWLRLEDMYRKGLAAGKQPP